MQGKRTAGAERLEDLRDDLRRLLEDAEALAAEARALGCGGLSDALRDLMDDGQAFLSGARRAARR